MLWIGLKGPSLLEKEKQFIQKEEVFGVVLFKRNIVSLPQLYELCRELNNLKPPPIIAIDREGGLVDRLKHFKPTPTPKHLGRRGLSPIERVSFLMHKELKAFGILVNFAPCLDLRENNNPLFKGRLFGSNPQDTWLKAAAWLKGAKQAGVYSCVKHFPGHGGVMEDPHKELAVDLRSLKALQPGQQVFQKAIEFGVPMIMTAHVLYPQWDKQPATLSKKILDECLKQKMGFCGLTVSDDLDMKALACFLNTKGRGESYRPSGVGDDHSLAVVLQALRAGVDLLLKCEPTDFVFQIPELLREAKLPPGLLLDKITKAAAFKDQALKPPRAANFKTCQKLMNKAYLV